MFLLNQISFSQDKTVIGLTYDEIAVLTNQNPDVTVDLSKYTKDQAVYFISVKHAQQFIDSVRDAMKKLNDVPERQVQLGVPVNGRFAPCGCGDYTANVGSAGLFSSFHLNFNYCNGAVSNGNISASGLQIGWSLGSTTGSYNGLYGCSNVTATFGYSILSWTQQVRIQWHFNPNSCTLYFTLGTGSCGMSLN